VPDVLNFSEFRCILTRNDAIVLFLAHESVVSCRRRQCVLLDRRWCCDLTRFIIDCTLIEFQSVGSDDTRWLAECLSLIRRGISVIIAIQSDCCSVCFLPFLTSVCSDSTLSVSSVAVRERERGRKKNFVICTFLSIGITVKRGGWL
jgi:hypothetical protein